MFLLLVVSELYLDLESPELYGRLQGDGVGPVQDGFLGLLVQQVKLDWVSEEINKPLKTSQWKKFVKQISKL